MGLGYKVQSMGAGRDRKVSNRYITPILTLNPKLISKSASVLGLGSRVFYVGLFGAVRV